MRRNDRRSPNSGPEDVVGIGFLVRSHMLVEVIEACDPLHASPYSAQLEFLAELVLVDAHEHVAGFDLGRVDVDIVVGFELAIGGDRLQRQSVAEIDRSIARRPPVRQLGRIRQGRRGPALEVVVDLDRDCVQREQRRRRTGRSAS